MNFRKRCCIGFYMACLLARIACSAEIPATFLDSIKSKQEARPERWKGVTKKSESKTNYFLPTGFIFTARLDNKIWSFNTQAPVIMVTEQDIAYLNRVVIPAGTRIIGTALVEKSHDRILVNLDHLIFPTGDEVHFSGMVLAPDGSVGIPGKVETYAKDAAIASTVLRSVISGTQVALQATEINPIAGYATGAVSQEAIKELDQRQEQATVSISVNAYTTLRVYINQRLEF